MTISISRPKAMTSKIPINKSLSQFILNLEFVAFVEGGIVSYSSGVFLDIGTPAVHFASAT